MAGISIERISEEKRLDLVQFLVKETTLTPREITDCVFRPPYMIGEDKFPIFSQLIFPLWEMQLDKIGCEYCIIAEGKMRSGRSKGGK